MLELLSPAGSYEAVLAAVQNGADAVYLGLGDFNARRNAQNFTEETLGQAIAYCHVRGVKVYVVMNTLASDRELVLVERAAKTVSRLGADAIIVQDLGVMRAIRQVLPEMPLHASTQMSVHNLEGVRRAAQFGASRVILARELNLAHIAYIAKNTDVELEVFVHGALCMSYSGQCYMSAAIGGRSGNRGLCAQPCRLPYSLDGEQGAHLSLKDYCLAAHLGALEKAGVACVKIEGRMKRPEYTAIATRVYRDAITEKRKPTEAEMKWLEASFSRQGFTDGYLKGEKGKEMLGVRMEENKREPSIFAEAKNAYLKHELQRVPVKFFAMIEAWKPTKIAVQDEDGNLVRLEGMVPEAARVRELARDQVLTQLTKSGGTPYLVQDVDLVLGAGISLPLSELNRLRREALTLLTEERARKPQRSEKVFRMDEKTESRTEAPRLNVSLLKASQLSEEFIALGPSIVYLPLDEILENQKKLTNYLSRPHTTFSAILPRVILDDERDALKEKLARVREIGITECLVHNMGHIALAHKEGFVVRGDVGFNVFNSYTLRHLNTLPLASVAASFELKMAQIRDLDKSMDLELVAYGRLPLMLTEHCIMHNVKGRQICDTAVHLSDRKGASFPVMHEAGCRNVIYNSKKLFLADRAADYMHIGLWGVRLAFTTENARECKEVLERYLGISTYEPGEFTRGLYYRGVE